MNNPLHDTMIWLLLLVVYSTFQAKDEPEMGQGGKRQAAGRGFLTKGYSVKDFKQEQG